MVKRILLALALGILPGIGCFVSPIGTVYFNFFFLWTVVMVLVGLVVTDI